MLIHRNLEGAISCKSYVGEIIPWKASKWVVNTTLDSKGWLKPMGTYEANYVILTTHYSHYYSI